MFAPDQQNKKNINIDGFSRSKQTNKNGIIFLGGHFLSDAFACLYGREKRGFQPLLAGSK